MGLFSSKRKATTDHFCREFYDQSVFAQAIAGSDPWRLFCDTSFKMIADADSNFRRTDLTSLMSELRAVRLEVVGLAWIHHVKDEFASLQSDFTKRYLEEKGAASVWEVMEDYNQATARSTTSGHDPKSSSGRTYLTFLNQKRARLFDEWCELGYDPKAVARAANRLGSDTVWKSRAVHTYLSFALTDRLECELNGDARLVIMALIQGFYEGASEAIKQVEIVE